MTRRLTGNRLAVLAFLVILGTVGAALFAPYLPLSDPDTVDTPNRLKPPLTPGHWLGTTTRGHDVLSQMMYGARIALFVNYRG